MNGKNVKELEALSVQADGMFKELKGFFEGMGSSITAVKTRFDDLLCHINDVEESITGHAKNNKDAVLDVKKFEKDVSITVNKISRFDVKNLDPDVLSSINNPVEDILDITTGIEKIKDTVELMIRLHEIRCIILSRVLGILPFEAKSPGDVEGWFRKMTKETNQIRRDRDGMSMIRLSRVIHDLMVIFHQNFGWKNTRMSEVISPGDYGLKNDLVRALKDTEDVNVNEFDGVAGIGPYPCDVYLEKVKEKHLQ